MLIVNNTDNYDLGWADEANPLLPVTTLTFCAGFPTPVSPSSLFSGTIRSWMLYLGYLNFDTQQSFSAISFTRFSETSALSLSIVTNCSRSVGFHNNSAYCLSCNDTNLLFNGSCFTKCPKKTLYSTDGLQLCFACNPNIQVSKNFCTQQSILPLILGRLCWVLWRNEYRKLFAI